jgi:glutathione S-transferase
LTEPPGVIGCTTKLEFQPEAAAMSEFVVYGTVGSPYLRAALMGFEEKALPYRLVPVPFGQSRSAEHMVRHPFGRVPVIGHGDFRLYETQAILRYLDRIAPARALTPADPRQAARMDQLAGIVDWYFFPQVSATIGYQRYVVPMTGRTPDEAIIAAALPKARICFAEIDRLKGESPYLAGGEVSIADLMLAPQMQILARTPEGEDLLKGTGLAAWIERMAARTSMQATTVKRLSQAA